jgi:hypothetical protein
MWKQPGDATSKKAIPRFQEQPISETIAFGEKEILSGSSGEGQSFFTG